MIAILEKISFAYVGLVVVAVSALYVLKPPPDAIPTEFLDRVEFSPSPTASAASRTHAAANDNTPSQQAPPLTKSDDLKIVEKLRAQGVSTSVTVFENSKRYGKISREQYSHISAESNVFAELKKLRRRFLNDPRGRPTRLVLEAVPSNSLLSVVGIEEGDVIELLDGEIVEFNDHSSTQYWDLYRQKLQGLRDGKPVTVTVTRNNQPVHLVFLLGDK
jgi:hypothetical protein